MYHFKDVVFADESKYGTLRLFTCAGIGKAEKESKFFVGDVVESKKTKTKDKAAGAVLAVFSKAPSGKQKFWVALWIASTGFTPATIARVPLSDIASVSSAAAMDPKQLQSLQQQFQMEEAALFAKKAQKGSGRKRVRADDDDEEADDRRRWRQHCCCWVPSFEAAPHHACS